MISYQPFFNTIKHKSISTYELILRHNISANTIQRIRKGKNISLSTVDKLCRILNCQISDICLYEDDSMS